MNIWVEYFRYDNAQVKDRRRNLEEGLVCTDFAVDKIQRRFFDTHKEAQIFCTSLQEQGYHTRIKEDRKL